MKKSNQPSKIKAFFQKLYWLPPLLLVAVVFILVFSLQGIKGGSSRIKTWFDPDRKCKTCELVNVGNDDVTNIITGGEATTEVAYVYYYDKDCAACVKANAALNIFVKAYNNDLKANGEEKVTVYGINYGVKEYNSIDTNVPETFRDKKMDLDTYQQISEDVRLFLAEVAPEKVSGIGENDYVIAAPSLVRYTKNAEGKYEVNNIITGTEMSVTTYFNQTTLKQFFDGNYEIK